MTGSQPPTHTGSGISARLLCRKRSASCYCRQCRGAAKALLLPAGRFPGEIGLRRPKEGKIECKSQLPIEWLAATYVPPGLVECKPNSRVLPGICRTWLG